jgi:hypothetical protein
MRPLRLQMHQLDADGFGDFEDAFVAHHPAS